MPTSRTVAIFHPDTHEVFLATEQPHPADARFWAYQLADGRWLGVTPSGGLTFTAEAWSFQAFTVAEGATYLLADRSAFGGRAYRLAFVVYTGPAGPIA